MPVMYRDVDAVEYLIPQMALALKRKKRSAAHPRSVEYIHNNAKFGALCEAMEAFLLERAFKEKGDWVEEVRVDEKWLENYLLTHPRSDVRTMLLYEIRIFESVEWKQVTHGEIVWLRGSHNDRFRAYGPHTVVDREKRTLKGKHGGDFTHYPEDLLILKGD